MFVIPPTSLPNFHPLILKIYTLEKGGSNGTSQVSWRPHGRISQRPVGGLFHRTRGRTEPNSIWRRWGASEPFRDLTGRGGRKHGIRAPLWNGASHSAGAWLPAHQSDVEIPGAQAC